MVISNKEKKGPQARCMGNGCQPDGNGNQKLGRCNEKLAGSEYVLDRFEPNEKMAEVWRESWKIMRKSILQPENHMITEVMKDKV